MPNVMAAVPNIALCSTPQSLADAQYWSAVQYSAKTRKPLKFAGMPQTNETISAASTPKFTILWGHVEQILLLSKFFSDCRYVPSLRRYSSTKLCDGAQMAIFWRVFASCIFQREACSTFQACILNLHYGHTMCGTMADVRRLRLGEEKRKKKNKLQGKNIMACPIR